IYEAHTERVETETLLNGVGQDSQRLAREQPIIARDVEAVARQIAEASLREQQSKSELETLEETSRQRHERIEEIDRQLAERGEHHRSLLEGVTQARVAAGEASQRHAALAEQIRGMTDTVSQAEAELANGEREQADIAARISQAEQTAVDTQTALEQLRQTAET